MLRIPKGPQNNDIGKEKIVKWQLNGINLAKKKKKKDRAAKLDQKVGS